ncbi:MAG: 4Fe-4S binding protein [Tepidibacter sp.]|uniref:4Fe-4S binding protein n=1 Tax=Tepidibacter sp. TaxID=2529387 RepID=UPI0025DEBC0C|nr:4Fe-4S binding protein [Tepidibacter sp.]MCT4508553.1 4Fe-4S binding protein [Tepidibacter sp.]
MKARISMRRPEQLEKQIKVDFNVEDYVLKDTFLFRHSENSKASHNIAALARKYGEGPPKFYPKTFEVMIDTGQQTKLSYESILRNPSEVKTSISSEELSDLIKYAKSLGINDIGFTKVNSKLIFKDHAILHDNAIVLTMEMDAEQISLAPSRDTGHEVHFTYNKLGRISNEIADYLRTKGFSAQAGPAMGGDVDYKHLAEEAAMGSIGNHGLLISPGIGPRQRITAVYTNIENLPFPKTNPHTWIKDFCKACKICSKRCPANAIVGIETASITNEYIDLPKCAKSFANSFGCSICIKECIFNRSDYHKVHKVHLKRTNIVD